MFTQRDNYCFFKCFVYKEHTSIINDNTVNTKQTKIKFVD